MMPAQQQQQQLDKYNDAIHQIEMPAASRYIPKPVPASTSHAAFPPLVHMAVLLHSLPGLVTIQMSHFGNIARFYRANDTGSLGNHRIHHVIIPQPTVALPPAHPTQVLSAAQTHHPCCCRSPAMLPSCRFRYVAIFLHCRPGLLTSKTRRALLYPATSFEPSGLNATLAAAVISSASSYAL
jgi:hypothetical protein